MRRATAGNLRLVEPQLPPEGVRIGKVVDIGRDGTVRVEVSTHPTGPVPARLAGRLLALGTQLLGAEVLLAFENGDAAYPIAIDTVHASAPPPGNEVETVVEAQRPDDIALDGERVVFTAQKEIVLRCGEATITLTRAGKILIRGAYLLSRSSGVNRIKGGAVQIN